MATPRRSRSTAKSLKRVTAGGLEGTWDTKRHCISLDLPVGVTSIKMIVEGVDGVHTMDFSSFECSASFVKWKDYDYPWSSSDFLLARESQRQGHCPPVTTSHPYPRCWDIVQFENPTRPPLEAVNDHGVATHTLHLNSSTCPIASCRALVTPSPTLPPPAAGGRRLSWGLRWPSPGAAPHLTWGPALLRALHHPRALPNLPPCLRASYALPPAVLLLLWDVARHLPPL